MPSVVGDGKTLEYFFSIFDTEEIFCLSVRILNAGAFNIFKPLMVFVLFIIICKKWWCFNAVQWIEKLHRNHFHKKKNIQKHRRVLTKKYWFGIRNDKNKCIGKKFVQFFFHWNDSARIFIFHLNKAIWCRLCTNLFAPLSLNKSVFQKLLPLYYANSVIYTTFFPTYFCSFPWIRSNQLDKKCE